MQIYANVCVIVSVWSDGGGSDVDMSSPLNYGTPSSRLGDTPRTPGALGTPHRSRADIRSERRPTVAVGASSELVMNTDLFTFDCCYSYNPMISVNILRSPLHICRCWRLSVLLTSLHASVSQYVHASESEAICFCNISSMYWRIFSKLVIGASKNQRSRSHYRGGGVQYSMTRCCVKFRFLVKISKTFVFLQSTLKTSMFLCFLSWS